MVERHVAQVHGLLHQRFGGVLDAASLEDVVAQALQRAWRSRHTFDASRGTARAWLGVIGHNCALQMLAKRQRMGLYLRDLGEHPAAEPEIERSEPCKQLLLDLHVHIARLPRLQRAVILADLANDGKAPAVTIEEDTGSSKGSIYVARSKAIRTLRRALAALGYEFARLKPARRGAAGSMPNSVRAARRPAQPREEG